jgi:undecaprenyl-diphosphatase
MFKFLPQLRTVLSHYALRFREIRAVYFMGVTLVAFLALAILVRIVGILPVDEKVTIFLQHFRTPFLDHIFETITLLGSAGTLILVAVIGVVLLIHIKQPKSAWLAGLSLLAYPLNVLIKDSVARLRPHSALIQVITHENGYSFPSGHAQISFVVYGAVAYLLWVYLSGYRRWLLILFAGILIFIIGISRVYLGVHWFSDVLGGWMIGAALLFGIIEIHQVTSPEAKTVSAAAVKDL